MSEKWPRRASIERQTPAERAIREAMRSVEEMAAHPLLTDAVVLLEDAFNAVADFVDEVPRKEPPPTETTREAVSGTPVLHGRVMGFDGREYRIAPRERHNVLRDGTFVTVAKAGGL